MPSNYMIPVLERTMGVLQYISEQKDGKTFPEILENQKIPKTTLFRILQTLEAHNWISKKGDKYSIGYMIIHYGLAGLSGRNVRLISQPYLEELRTLTTETAHLAVLSGRKSMIIEVCDSQKHIKLTSPIGSLLDLHCTAHGKIFLAYKLRDEVDEMYKNTTLAKRTVNTLTDLRSLKDELKKIIKNGYALDDREYFDNVRCLAAPVWGQDNEIVAAVGVTATTQDFTPSMIPKIAQQVTEITKKISREMGGS